MEICSRCIYDDRVSSIFFHVNGNCNYCRTIDNLIKEYSTGSEKAKMILKT